MKIIVLISFILFLNSSLFTQPQFNENELIVIASEVNLREKASKDSKSLLKILNGETIEPLYKKEDILIEDEINNLSGYWLKVKYKTLIGYIFSGYLGTRYQLFYEDEEIGYYPKVKNWYGIYFNDKLQREQIKKIETSTVLEKLDGNTNGQLILKTNQNVKSLFLLATNVDLQEREIGLFTKYFTGKGDENQQELRPGDTRWLFFKIDDNNIASEMYHIMATGSFSFVNHNLELSNYQVLLADKEPPDHSYYRIQNLTSYINKPGTYRIIYAGDIDNDEKPDFILGGTGNSGGIEVLFLSSMAKNGELVRPVSIWYWPNNC